MADFTRVWKAETGVRGDVEGCGCCAYDKPVDEAALKSYIDDLRNELFNAEKLLCEMTDTVPNLCPACESGKIPEKFPR